MKDFRKIEPTRLRRYCGQDVSATLRLYEYQRARMGPFAPTWHHLVGPAFWALGHVERWGALLSERNVRAYDQVLTARAEKARADLLAHPEVPRDFNPRSNPQKLKLLVETLKLKSPLKTKTKAPSFSAEALEMMIKEYPDQKILPALRDLATAEQLKSMYGIDYLKHIGYDGRVHPKYKIVRSGRLSCNEPNLQNLKSPDDDDEVEDDGKWARGCYVAPDGYVLVSLDQGQQELRVAAELSGDEVMAAALASKDTHRATAAEIFRIEQDAVSKLQRRVGKETNFGIAFNQGSYALSAKLTSLAQKEGRPAVSEEEAQGYIDSLLGRYKKFAGWRRKVIAEGQASGDSWARWGRWCHRRQVPDFGMIGETAAAKKIRKHAENVCVNNPIQNVANCINLDSLFRCVSWIVETGAPAEVCMTVHDSIVLYVRRDAWQDVARAVRKMMLAYPMKVCPLKVDVELGEADLGHMKKVELD